MGARLRPLGPPPEPAGNGPPCPSCGAPLTQGDHRGCAYDPPRFCPACGRRLRVQVYPNGYSARCLACPPIV